MNEVVQCQGAKAVLGDFVEAFLLLAEVLAEVIELLIDVSLLHTQSDQARPGLPRRYRMISSCFGDEKS